VVVDFSPRRFMINKFTFPYHFLREDYFPCSHTALLFFLSLHCCFQSIAVVSCNCLQAGNSFEKTQNVDQFQVNIVCDNRAVSSRLPYDSLLGQLNTFRVLRGKAQCHSADLSKLYHYQISRGSLESQACFQLKILITISC